LRVFTRARIHLPRASPACHSRASRIRRRFRSHVTGKDFPHWQCAASVVSKVIAKALAQRRISLARAANTIATLKEQSG
jgi:hypothetical protein